MEKEEYVVGVEEGEDRRAAGGRVEKEKDKELERARERVIIRRRLSHDVGFVVNPIINMKVKSLS